ncbi:MAG: cation:proton antiporter [Nanoarchaeota archaeon]
MAIDGNLFFEIGVIFIITAIAAFLLRLMKQPQILSYVVVGILVTPLFGIITNTSLIESMSTVGIAFLLFIVGLEMNIKSLKNVALVSGIGGIIQILILFVFGYFLALLLGFLSVEAAYIGLILAFSSTMVVVKILSDRRELNTLHGHIIVGTLLVQDIVAIFALSVLTSINDFSATLFILSIIKFISLFLLSYIGSKYLFPTVFRYAAKHPELLLISSLAVCFLFSLTFAVMGFSLAIGAFLAGVALGNLEYNLDIIGKVRSLKDFFSLLFFVSLGMGFSLAVVQERWIEILVILLLILVLKPFIVMVVCSLFKYTKKPSFLTANALAQVGEFSLILAAQGLALGHISSDLFSITVIITIVSIVLTSYYMEYNQFFYRILRWPLRFFNRFTTEGLEYVADETKPTVVLCGYNRLGYSIMQAFHKNKKDVLIVDYNPEIIAHVMKEGYHCIYGDVADEDIIHRMNLPRIRLLISTVPSLSDNLLLIRKVREINKSTKIFVTASDVDDALTLYKNGADYVVLPHFLGGEHVANLISDLQRDKIKIHEHRKGHIQHLLERKRMGHKHPAQE